MDRASTLPTDATPTVPAAVVGVPLLAFGLPELLGVGVLVALGAAAVRSLADDPDTAPERINCAECGAPNPPGRKRCDYCAAPLNADGEHVRQNR